MRKNKSSSLIQTVLSVPESHRIGRIRGSRTSLLVQESPSVGNYRHCDSPCPEELLFFLHGYCMQYGIACQPFLLNLLIFYHNVVEEVIALALLLGLSAATVITVCIPARLSLSVLARSVFGASLLLRVLLFLRLLCFFFLCSSITVSNFHGKLDALLL